MVKEVARRIISFIEQNKGYYSNNEFIFVCGPMGSGKTTYINNKILHKYPNCFYCSIDEYIKHFIESSWKIKHIVKLN